jgi:hypothetical protein
MTFSSLCTPLRRAARCPQGGYDSGRHTLLGASSSCQESTSRSSLLSSFSSSNCGAGGGSSFSTAVTAVGSSCGAAVASGRAARLSLSGDDALSQLRLGAVLGAGNFGRWAHAACPAARPDSCSSSGPSRLQRAAFCTLLLLMLAS